MIEAMGDIQLEDFDRDFLRAYESKLRTIPANRNLVKAKYGVKTLDQLIAKAAECGDKLMTEESVRKYINGIYGAMKWAVADGKLLKSPCENFFHPMIKMSEIRITLTYLNRMKLKRFFRYRGLRLELLNAMRKGDSINIARLLLDAFAWLDDGGAS
jgi:hypothetical protein